MAVGRVRIACARVVYTSMHFVTATVPAHQELVSYRKIGALAGPNG